MGDAKAVAGVNGHVLVLKSDNTVWSWGYNPSGQLGDGSFEGKLLPTGVSGLGDVLEIAAGNEHALVRRRDGTVWGWGMAAAAALGNTPAASALAVPLSTPTEVQQLAAGGQNSALITRGGLVYMAAGNSVGELGDGTFARQPGFVLKVNASTDGLLDLVPNTPYTPLTSVVPAFLVKTERRGDLSSLTLRTNVFGLLGTSGAVRAVKLSVD